MIRGVRDRATFAALRPGGGERGNRFRPLRSSSGPLQFSFVPDARLPADRRTGRVPVGVHQLAFAIPRQVGPAVERNRLRRRLRAILREAVATPNPPPAGAYLVRARPPSGALTYSELSDHVHRALNDISQRTARTSAERP